jgi:GNAT superfamily N-acetyltransferase
VARRSLPGGFELDDDRGRVDPDAVHAYLTRSYWAEGRSREVVAALVENAARVVGLYDDGGRQVGFCRVVSDGHAHAYLADVYVLEPYRGRGLGIELVREAIEHGPHAELSWLLHTRDAHTLYARFGFGEPSERVMERPRSR